jgi:Holliday junction resolvase RusA-like endonuclease
MKKIYKITIPGKPIPLQRPRLGPSKIYDQQKKQKNETAILITAQTDFPPDSDGVAIELIFHMKIPKGKKKKLLNKPHTKRPDIDNLIKFYLDVCNGLLYEDDAQIYTIKASKIYGEEEKTELTIIYGDNHGI